jgi:dTDP-4-amino-4,6-dideoxygalactose transaminase
MRVPFFDLPAQHSPLKRELLLAVEKVLNHGMFILGPEVEEFENEFAKYNQIRHAIGVANGTDALVLALKSLGIGSGDEVITVPHSFLASTSAIVLAGATPVFVDVNEDGLMDVENLAGAMTEKTKAILPVHLGGKAVDMDAVMTFARSHHLYVIEDASQAVGSRFYGQELGTFGHIGCFSLHPLKNLGCCGDGGVVITQSDEIATKIKIARNHGLADRNQLAFWSLNSRLDTIQAAMLLVKMPHLDEWIERRIEIVNIYREYFDGKVNMMRHNPYEKIAYHTFTVRIPERDLIQSRLLEEYGIETKVHYPIPIHQQPCARQYCQGEYPIAEKIAKEILSLPIDSAMIDEEAIYVAQSLLKLLSEVTSQENLEVSYGKN